MTAEKLGGMLRQDKDLWVDRQGRLFFADAHTPENVEPPTTGSSSPTVLVPIDQTFVLHSRPAATKKIFLDFDGHTTSGTSWRDIQDGDSTFVTPTYDYDGNAASFSSNELARIQFIWQRVAEDFSPFDVDVTTEDPGVEGLRKATTSDVNYGIRVCIGGASTDWYSTNGYGGVAYIGSFDYNSDTPCFVFENNLGNGNEKYVAEAVSHEVGHTLDLYHDGTSTVGYYQGHGTGADGWAPIMGVGYYKPVAQFSRGEYAGANNTEDDLAKITASYNIPYIADDYGNDLAGAAALPAGSFYADGLIERNTDIDVFSFNAGAGTFNLSVNVDSRSPNLNVEAKLYDGLGNLMALSNPSNTLAASFNLAGMAAGTYYLTVDGVGAGNPTDSGYSGYGSIGTYSISGNVPQSGHPVAAASATPATGIAPLVVQLLSTGSTDPDGGGLSYAWALGNGETSSNPNPATTYFAPGVYTAQLTVTDEEGLSSVATVQVTVADVPPAAPSTLLATPFSSTRVDLAWVDNSGNETGFQIERSTDGANFSQIGTVGANTTSYSDTTASGGAAYSYRVRATNAYGQSAYSNVSSATTPQSGPAAPSTLAGKAAAKTQINLTWRDNANNESGFYVERSSNGGSWSRIATLGANSTSYAATGLTANTSYSFRVQSFNAVGTSAYSNSATTKTRR